MRNHRRALAYVLAAIMGSLAACLTVAPAVAVSADRYTPLVASVMSTPRWFKGTDDRIHLVYQLELTNGFPVPVTVESVTVRDGARDRTLTVLAGAHLRESMSLLADPTEPTTTVAASSVAVVWLDVVLRHRRQLPRSVTHTIKVSPAP